MNNYNRAYDAHDNEYDADDYSYDAHDYAYDADNEYDISATDQMFDLLDLYRTNPELAAAQLIKHLQSVAIDSKDIETSFKSRANDTSDWRYQNKTASDVSDQAPDITNISRLTGLAKGVASGGDQEPAPTVKDMGPVQYAKDTPALPSSTKPEFDLTPDLKSKEKVPVQRKGGMAESTELSSILKNAGLKTKD